MSRSVKISLIAMVIIELTILLFFAASDNFFFSTLNMTQDTAFEERNGGYESHFYTYKNPEEKNTVRAGTVFYDIKQDSENIVHITFRISPINRFKVHSIHLNASGFQPASALILENPESGQSLPFVYTRTDNTSSVALDFPDLNLDYEEPVTIDFWLDLLDIEPVAKGHLVLDAFFSVHDESVFKIVKYVSHLTIELDIPFIVQ